MTLRLEPRGLELLLQWLLEPLNLADPLQFFIIAPLFFPGLFEKHNNGLNLVGEGVVQLLQGLSKQFEVNFFQPQDSHYYAESYFGAIEQKHEVFVAVELFQISLDESRELKLFLVAVEGLSDLVEDGLEGGDDLGDAGLEADP